MKLVDCKFCGNKASILDGSGSFEIEPDGSISPFSVMCERRNPNPKRSHFLGEWYKTEEEAIKEWNKIHELV